MANLGLPPRYIYVLIERIHFLLLLLLISLLRKLKRQQIIAVHQKSDNVTINALYVCFHVGQCSEYLLAIQELVKTVYSSRLHYFAFLFITTLSTYSSISDSYILNLSVGSGI